MSRVLLVCPEPLGHRQPAGVGIRFLEMARVLVADGHAVTLLSPDAAATTGCHAAAITPENLRKQSGEADVAVLQGHAANDFFAHGRPIPTVIDLYDPFIVENLHYYHNRGAEVFSHDHATLLSSLGRGDLFLCASDAQRLFYLGALLAIGRLNPVAFERDGRLASLIRVVPFGVQPPRERAPADLDNPRVLFGGIYDWYDPLVAIDALVIARHTIPNLSLTFTLHPNPSLTPQGKAAEAIRYVKKRGLEAFIRFEPWFEYDGRGEFFDRFAIALLTFRQSLETDLSMRTRVYDYLWGGLPIVTSSAPGTDELLTRYGAGRVVPSESPADFAAAMVEVLRSEHARMRAAARHFVEEHQWPRVLQPLRDFCRKPRVDPTKEAFAVRMQLPERPPSILARLKRRIGGGS
jgi:glycosyltransferase involved in cell wall biosynthesis